MRSDSRTPKGPTDWREDPRDENAARKTFPHKSGFIAHLRATNRPTTRDLRKLRALKKTPMPQAPAPG